MSLKLKEKFMAYRAEMIEGKLKAGLISTDLDSLDPGDLVIKTRFSSVNFKDALGATGRGKIYKKFPIIGGIDVAGEVVSSESPDFKPGDPVLVTGCGLGEKHDGGYAEYVRVPAAWALPLAEGLTLRESMILGTAGFTAALCIHRLQTNDQTPDKGPIVVSGASGGVGSLSIPMLASLGYDVIAVSSKKSAVSYLEGLGAKEVKTVEELDLGQKPLESTRFGGAIDNVGGKVLEGLIRHTNLWGNIASVGLAADFRFQSTVMPFILRGVSLLGISSTNCPRPLRLAIWKKLGGEWKPKNLESIIKETVQLSELDGVFARMMDRKTMGRILVEL